MLFDSLRTTVPDVREPRVFYPIRLDQLVGILGWTVERVQMAGTPTVDGYRHGKSDFEKKQITLSVEAEDGTIAEEQIRFTLAHEIGHILLHSAAGSSSSLFRIRKRSYRRAPAAPNTLRPRRFEIEANDFASQLLMPTKAVINQFAELFGCPRLSMSSQQCHAYLHTASGGDVSIETACRSLAGYSSDNKKSLSSFFGVSNSAMGFRIASLGLVFP
jgi:hypothetical protein